MLRAEAVTSMQRELVERARATDIAFLDNTVRGNGLGVAVISGGPRLEGNTIEANRVGLALIDSAPVLVGNRVCNNDTNLNWPEGEARPSTDGNDVCPEAPAENGS